MTFARRLAIRSIFSPRLNVTRTYEFGLMKHWFPLVRPAIKPLFKNGVGWLAIIKCRNYSHLPKTSLKLTWFESIWVKIVKQIVKKDQLYYTAMGELLSVFLRNNSRTPFGDWYKIRIIYVPWQFSSFPISIPFSTVTDLGFLHTQKKHRKKQPIWSFWRATRNQPLGIHGVDI